MKLCWLMAAGLCSTMLLAAPLSAQRSADSIFREAQQHNWYIRVVGSSTPLGEGRVTAVQSDTVMLGARTRVPIDKLVAIERRLNHGGGWLGGGLGAAAIMGALAFGFVKGMCESSNCHEGAAFLVGAAVGFPVGATVGLMVSPMEHSWIKVYP